LPTDDAAAFDLIGLLVSGTNTFGIGLQFSEINISANGANLMSLSIFSIAVYCKGNGVSGTAYSAVKEQAGKYYNNYLIHACWTCLKRALNCKLSSSPIIFSINWKNLPNTIMLIPESLSLDGEKPANHK